MKKRQFINPQAIKKSLADSAKARNERFIRAKISHRAVKPLFKYFHLNINEIKEAPHADFKNILEEINYYFAPHSIHFRQVKLTANWSRNAIGPMIAVFKKDKKSVALIPNKNGHGYHFRNPRTNMIHFVRIYNERLFEEDAYLLYRPFKNKRLTFKDFFHFLFSEVTRLEIIEYLLIVVAASTLGLFLPHLTKWIFTEIEIAQDTTVFYTFIIMISGFILITLLFTCYKLFISSRISLKVSISLQSAAMERVISLPTEFFKKYSAGELASRLSYLSSAASVLINSIGATAISLIFSIIYLVQIFIFSISLALVAIVITILMVAFDIVIIIYAERNIRERIKIDTKESGMSYAMIAGIEKIKIAGAEKRMYDRWLDLFTQSVDLTYNPPFVIKIRTVVNSLISLSGALSLYIMAIYTQIKAADYYAFSTIYGMAMGSLLSFNAIAVQIALIRPYYEIAKPILDTLPEVAHGQLYLSNITGEIRLEHVSFRYEKKGPNVIDDLSLHIKPGQEIAIVGETGSGKSTLIRLLLGFEKTQKGDIYYDKYNIKQVELKSLRHLIGTVMQDVRLFTGDVYSNIVVSSPWKSVSEAWEASKIAAFDEDIKAMPMGMKTILQEGEGGISGGQRQRLAIARAVVNNPKILIFDEATSALDNITQKKVNNAIKKMKCTRIIIAHRLSTVIHADQIYILKNGRLDEHGTYKELLKKKGEFSKLMIRQKL